MASPPRQRPSMAMSHAAGPVRITVGHVRPIIIPECMPGEGEALGHATSAVSWRDITATTRTTISCNSNSNSTRTSSRTDLRCRS